MIKKILLVIISSIAFASVANGYFESRYWCNSQTGSLTISMNTWQQKCFDYLASIHQDLTQINTDLTQANNYISFGTDVSYRNSVVETLLDDRDDLRLLQSQAIIAINDFERALFNQIKSLLQFYLAEQRTWVLNSIERLRIQIDTAKRTWNTLQYTQLINNMETLQIKLFMLDRIQFAHDFEELVPFLKKYLYGSWQL